MNPLKKSLLKMSLLSLILLAPISIHAKPAKTISISLDGQMIGEGYISKENYTMIPLRVLSEMLKYNVKWDGPNEKVIIKKGDTTIEIIMDYHLAKVNDDYIQLTSEATVLGGTSYVPLRFVADVLGLQVGYSGQIAYVSTSDKAIELSKGEMLTFAEMPSYLLGNGYNKESSQSRAYYKTSYGADGMPYSSSYGQVIVPSLVTISFGDNSQESLIFIKDLLERFVPNSADEIYKIISTQDVIPLQIMESDGKKIAFEAGAHTSLDFTFDGTTDGEFIKGILEIRD